MLARAPSATGKTRLTKALSDDRARALRRALLLDTIESAAVSGFPVIVCYTPASAAQELAELVDPLSSGGPGLPPSREALRRTATAVREANRQTMLLGRVALRPDGAEAGQSRPRLIPQSDGDLGARMRSAFDELFALGFGRVVLIGSDLPTMPPEHMAMAMAALDRAPIVLGPADDGGYYLIGLREPHPELFGDIAWGSPDVLLVTLARARRAGAAVECVPAWHDVDTPDDLPRVASSSRAPRTRAWLASQRP